MRKHFVSRRRVWLAIALVVIVSNELLDRNFFDQPEHIDGDFAVTILVLLIAFLGSSWRPTPEGRDGSRPSSRYRRRGARRLLRAPAARPPRARLRRAGRAR